MTLFMARVSEGADGAAVADGAVVGPDGGQRLGLLLLPPSARPDDGLGAVEKLDATGASGDLAAEHDFM
jgi:hypothetical protein